MGRVGPVLDHPAQTRGARWYSHIVVWASTRLESTDGWLTVVSE
jgi:hypothetical protein